MENSTEEHSDDNQIQILKFMEVSQCQSYQQAKFYVAMNNYKLKDAISAYLASKDKQGISNRSTTSNLETPPRLRSSTDQNQQKLKKGLKKKINSMKKDDNRIFYFQQIYHSELHQAGFELENDWIESFELSNVQENQKMKTVKNQPIKPIFALVVPNRKTLQIENFLKNGSLITFIRQNFEVIFLTLSELKEIQLPRNHCLRNIRKCPTAMTYLKNFYDLEDVLVRFQGESLKETSIQRLKKSLQEVQSLTKKWSYLLQLQKQLKSNSITSLNQVVHYESDSDDQNHGEVSEFPTNYHQQHQDSKKSLIQQQTKIYEQMAAEQSKRKKSIELEKQRLEEIKELREVRKLSLPQEPGIQQIHESIEFRFRCPLNGEYITRKFLKNQKVDILYQFVDINDQIEFQNEPERNFDLFTSFPPTSLFEKKNELLENVFDQQKQNILIREV